MVWQDPIILTGDSVLSIAGVTWGIKQTFKIGGCLSSGGQRAPLRAQPSLRASASQSVARRLPLPEGNDGGADNAKMKGLFKSKPRTPADLVRQTRDLLIFVDLGAPDTKESKRDEKVFCLLFWCIICCSVFGWSRGLCSWHCDGIWIDSQ